MTDTDDIMASIKCPEIIYFFEAASILQSHVKHVEQNNLDVCDITIYKIRAIDVHYAYKRSTVHLNLYVCVIYAH